MPTDFTLPELGEQIEAGDVLRVLVKAGDTISKEQPVLELETDKATIEVPSSVAGTVKEIKVKAGDKVKVGQAILSYDEAAGAKKADGKAEEGARERPAEAVPRFGADASGLVTGKVGQFSGHGHRVCRHLTPSSRGKCLCRRPCR